MSGEASTSLPLKKSQRYAGFFSIFWLWAGGNVLLTNFISGSSYASGLGFENMLVITVTGFMLGFAFCSWNSQRSARYGIDEIVSLRPAFGPRGSAYGTLVLVCVNFGWVGILAALAGTATKIVADGQGISFTGDYYVYSIGAGIFIPLLIITYSQKASFTVSRLVVPLLVAFVGYIVVRLFIDGHISTIVNKPGDGSSDWAIAFEIIFAFSISWFPYLGSWNRFSSTEKSSFWGTYLGLLVTGVTFAVVGGMATLATGEIDPAIWANELDLGLVSLLIIVLGTITAVTHLLGSGSMGILSTFPHTNYRIVCVLVTVPSAIFVFGASLQGIFDTLLIFIGLLVGPYWAVALVDYFFLRRQRIDVKACFDTAGPYWYSHGFNVLAFVSVLVGMAVWVFLGGWQSGFSVLTFSAGQEAFGRISATLPAMVASGGVYYLLGKTVIPKLGLGGYDVAHESADNPEHAIARLEVPVGHQWRATR
ncbi:cytosine permease [Rhodococcus sp. NPDC049939]|uniref:purine-cytosine permease family protein n=1 Tax=Rhodococcus sp. NPDC049939 TaxID=3155511 RepID=UPI0033F7ABD2